MATDKLTVELNVSTEMLAKALEDAIASLRLHEEFPGEISADQILMVLAQCTPSRQPLTATISSVVVSDVVLTTDELIKLADHQPSGINVTEEFEELEKVPIAASSVCT